MSKQDKNVYEAKKSLRAHIKFLKSLLLHLDSTDDLMKGRAMWASWCLHRYFNDGLVPDIEKAMKEHGGENAQH